jgi:hypothetical protein
MMHVSPKTKEKRLKQRKTDFILYSTDYTLYENM